MLICEQYIMSLLEKMKNNKGASLLELLVALTMFTFMMLAAIQIFKMVIDGQHNAISAQNTQENIRYALEKISKEIRMAQISNASCLPAATNKVFNVVAAGGNDRIYFKNKDGNCLAYYLENNRLIIAAGVITDFVTPAKIEVSNLKFSVVDDLIGAFHSVQPSVTIAMDIKAVGLALHEQRMKIQMTVSSRYYE